MWILSQTKKHLYNADTISEIELSIHDPDNFMIVINFQKEYRVLGKYVSMKRCSEVLEDIIRNLEEECMTVDLFSESCMNHIPYVRQQKTIFRMPEE